MAIKLINSNTTLVKVKCGRKRIFTKPAIFKYNSC